MAPTVTINGSTESIAHRDPTMTLLQHLRGTGRLGTKEGCAEGDCGACTVALVEADGRVHAVNSCLLPLGAAAGRSFITVEGVALQPDSLQAVELKPVESNPVPLHPVQQALVDAGGSQCGYCTPGFVMSMFAAYHEGETGDEAIEGNLCRCTGYLPIRQAAASLHGHSQPHPLVPRASGAAGATPGESASKGAADPESDSEMRGAGSRYVAPKTLSDTLELLATNEDAKPIAGGTDLGVDITKFQRRFPLLVSVEHLPELQVLAPDQDGMAVIGGAVPLTRVERELRGVFPALDEMLRWFAARQIRNRATLGGNLGTASPIGDLAPVLLALDAQLELVSSIGSRTVAIADFFHGYRQTERRRDELIATVRIPLDPHPGATARHAQSYKVGKRGTDDISIVAACFRVDLVAHGKISAARLAYGGVAAIPARARDVEDQLVGQPWSEDTAVRAGKALQDTFTPLDDHRGSAAYRRRLTQNLFEKFFHEHRSTL